MTGKADNEAVVTFKKTLTKASLNAELSHQLGYAPGAEPDESTTNHCHGGTSKTANCG